MAKALLADVARGHDPAEQRAEQRKAMTVKQLCAAYVDACEKGMILGKRGQPKKRSTLYVDRGRIDRHIVPLLGNDVVRNLTTPRINRFMREVASGRTTADIKTRPRGRAIVKGGRGTAARTVGLLGGIMSFAINEGVIDANPVRGVKRPADKRREVRLSFDEYTRLGKALSESEALGVNPKAVVAAKLLALTGCRRGEIEHLQWREVDFVGHCLRLNDSKEGRSVRPLGESAIEILAELPRDGDFVLPGSSFGKPFSGLSRVWRRIVARAELFYLSPHGLRHAFASIASDLGYAEATIAALLGHSTRTTTSRYVHHLDAALVAAADKISGQIAVALEGRGSGAEVIPLRRLHSHVP